MAVDIKGDTEQVKNEFDNLSTPTQVFIWSLVGLGVVIGLLLGGAVAYGIAVEEVDGQDCIELDDTLYCEDQGSAAGATDDTTDTTDDEDDGLLDDGDDGDDAADGEDDDLFDDDEDADA
jgi:hypothetical protein